MALKCHLQGFIDKGQVRGKTWRSSSGNILSLGDRRFTAECSRSGLSELYCKSILAEEILFHFILLFLCSFIPASLNCSSCQYPVSWWLCNSRGPKWELKHSSDSGHCSHLKNWMWQQPIKSFKKKKFQKCIRGIVPTHLNGNLFWHSKPYWFTVRWRSNELYISTPLFTIT